MFARFRFVSELSKGSRNRIPCDFVRQYLVSQARLSREGACILNCCPLPICNSLKTADRRTCSEDLATGTWPSGPPASRQAVRMTQSNIPYQSGVPNPNGTCTWVSPNDEMKALRASPSATSGMLKPGTLRQPVKALIDSRRWSQPASLHASTAADNDNRGR